MLASVGAGQPMPRNRGDPIAMRAAYGGSRLPAARSSTMPAIDTSPIHGAGAGRTNAEHQAASRQRALNKMGNSDNMVVAVHRHPPGRGQSQPVSRSAPGR